MRLAITILYCISEMNAFNFCSVFNGGIKP